MINETIRQLRRKAGLTQEEVAHRVGTPRAYISQIENGFRSPSERMAENILIRGIGLSDTEAQRVIRQWKLHKVGLPTEFTPIPLLGCIPCGQPKDLGSPSLRWDGYPLRVYEKADSYVSLPYASIPKGHRVFAVQADGLSMIGEVLPDDIIICDPDEKVSNGDMVIVKLDDGFTLKRIHFKDGYVRLEPANSGFKPIETSRIEIVARVIYVIKKY